MTFDIFLSYSTHDTAVAELVCSTLESKGITCWIAPRNITPGVHWGEAIIEGINDSKIMVVIFSDNSNKSQQVLREVERAVSKGLYILPFRIQPTLPSKSMEYFLSTTHWFNALTVPLEVHIERLVGLIQGVLQSIQIEDEPAKGPAVAPPEETTAIKEVAPVKDLNQKEREQLQKLQERISSVLSHASETIAIGKKACEGLGLRSELLNEQFLKVESFASTQPIAVAAVLPRRSLLESFLDGLFGGRVKLSGLPDGVVLLKIRHSNDSPKIGYEGAPLSPFQRTNPIENQLVMERTPDSTWTDTVIIELPDKELNGTSILIVLDRDKLPGSPGLVSRVVTGSNLLAIIDQSEANVPEATLAILKEMVRVGNLLPIINGLPDNTVPPTGWWSELSVVCDGLSIPPVSLPESAGESHLHFLFDRQHPIRKLLHLTTCAQNLWNTTAVVADEREQLLRSFRVNQIAKRREIAFIDSAGLKTLSTQVTGALANLNSGLEELVGGVSQLNRRSLNPGGRFHQLVRTIVSKIKAEDLAVDRSNGTAVCLSPEFLKAVAADLRKPFVDQMRADLRLFEDGLGILLDEFTQVSGLAKRVSDLVKAVKRPAIEEALPLDTVIKSHYRGEVADKSNVKASRFNIMKFLQKNDVPREKFVEAARGAFSWEIQLHLKELIDRKLSLFKNVAEAIKRAIAAALGGDPIDGSGNIRKDLEEKLGRIEAQIGLLEAKGSEIQDLQQACAEVDSSCRGLVREYIKPLGVQAT